MGGSEGVLSVCTVGQEPSGNRTPDLRETHVYRDTALDTIKDGRNSRPDANFEPQGNFLIIFESRFDEYYNLNCKGSLDECGVRIETMQESCENPKGTRMQHHLQKFHELSSHSLLIWEPKTICFVEKKTKRTRRAEIVKKALQKLRKGARVSSPEVPGIIQRFVTDLKT
ncbi:uncharacterized protein LOC143145482 [Ptiloglossa arizonensis]|uniref:uncharacterized protein LOC143145482 n=1 Tax=Ptiloglossa arizonensis TaxID=3350558 RepID=UPI003FA1731F